jgi:phospholipid-translocating ATPase
MCTDLLLCSDVELLNAVANNSHVIKFLTVMTLCNTVIPIKSSSGAILYKAQSQDEDALVNAASNLHMVLVNKNGNTAEIHFNRRVVQYEILDILEFTSDRKRMSVVVLDCESGKIFLLSKGADEAIIPCAYSGNHNMLNIYFHSFFLNCNILNIGVFIHLFALYFM